MNRKQLTLILVVVVVVGAVGLWVQSRNAAAFKTSEGRMGQKALGTFDVNSVARIHIRHGTNDLNLVKLQDQWVVRERGDYPANFTQISDFLRKAYELKVVQPVAVGPSQLARLELAPPGPGAQTGTLVELMDAGGKVIKTLLLGKKHTRQAANPSGLGGDEGWPDGRYIMTDNQLPSVCLVSETFSALDPKPDQWLDKDFFKVEKVRSVEVTFPVATNSWKLTRETETGELKLVEAKPDEKLDATKVSGIPNALSYPSFNDVVAHPNAAETGLDKPTIAQLDTFDDFHYTVKIGNKSGEDNYFMTVAVNATLPKERAPGKDEKKEQKAQLDKEFKDKVQRLTDKLTQEQRCASYTYLVPKWTFDTLLKPRHELLVEKKEEKKPEVSKEETPSAPEITLPALPGKP